MKKVLSNIKKVIVGFISFLYTLATNNYAVTQELYGVMPIEKPIGNSVVNNSASNTIASPDATNNPILKVLIIPAIFIIGVAIYLKKSKSTKKKKIIITIIAAILALLVTITAYDMIRINTILY